MTTITAENVKALRERTGAGMMECKKALVEAGGDLDQAAEAMRKAGLAKADKKAGRVAAEGVIVTAVSADGQSGVAVEVNCETDFVAREKDFQAFAGAVANAALASGQSDLEAVLALPLEDGQTIEDVRRGLVARIGENITVRRVARLSGSGRIASYVHGGRIGVLVSVTGGDDEVTRDIAMHVAASNPRYAVPAEVPQAELDKEREILSAQAAQEGKPEAIVAKMVEGRVRKYLAEICLVGQPFVKDPDITVEKRLQQAGATVQGFVRYEVGEGIEKKQENFADEVAAQVRAAQGKA
ncbi:MAG: translation elongation factor Ts [Steroidobacteraceae bacterium]